MSKPKPVVYVPVKLDAFVLNQFSSKGYPDNASIAPIAQPNYTFLRLDAGLIQNDVLPYHDISHASPASVNPRLTDLGTGKPKTRRQGVYLHWMLPRCYRTGSSAQTSSAPVFKTAPDRWLVIRRLHPGAEPSQPVQDGRVKELTAWIVESNRLRNVQELDKTVDIETDCSPYLKGGGDLTSLDGQAEIYIGQKTRLDAGTSWKESAPNPDQFVPLGTLNAANPFFADYVCHNQNVFSILDNFEYTQGNQKAYLTKATASYYVIGWHGEENQDFLTNPSSTTMLDLLANNFLDMNAARNEDFLNKPSSGRVLCHGAMYTVNYTSAESTAVQPSADAAKKFANPKSHPVTVGTTPLDSVLSYVRAYNDSVKQGGNKDDAMDEVQTDLYHLETLLLKQEADIDAQQEAHDMLSANNFEPCQDSGSFWHFSAATPNPTNTAKPPSNRAQKLFEPTMTQRKQLKILNDVQAALDATQRELKHEQWNLFSLWWKFASDRNWMIQTTKIQEFPNDTQPKEPKRLVELQVAMIKELKSKVDNLSDAVKNTYLVPFRKSNFDPKKPEHIVEQGSKVRFYTQKDPTILVPGVPNPWPRDWLDAVPVRFASQVQVPELPGQLPSGWQSLKDLIEKVVTPCLPTPEMKTAASALAKEFFNLRPLDDPKAKETPSIIRGKDPATSVLPHYHDGRHRWNNTQAWFPLFLEWEIRYNHLPWSAWDFEQVPIPFRPNENARIRYGIKPDQIVSTMVKGKDGKIKDEREIDGRVLILPQPGYSLRISVEQLLKATNEADLPADLRPHADGKTGNLVDPRSEFLADIDRIQMLSAPMSGFMDHLTTRLQGTHIKPTFRDPKNPTQVGVLSAAMIDPLKTGLTRETLALMGIDLDKTPFSDFIMSESGEAPHKPVTHGQFRFTKLNIIDKFGQCISAINPRPSNNIPPLYPNLSEYFHPQALNGDVNRDNVIIEDPAGCQYAQYPPTINQDARLNSHLMQWDGDLKTWRPCGDWDSPIWGYVVLNYAENGIQIFLPDGQFYREVRLGGPTGATQSIEWQPFEPPKEKKDGRDVFKAQGFPQLDALMKQLSNEEYLRSFFGMVNKALAALPHTPNQYAEYLNAIIGRPLALTNIGFSIELATPPLKNQSTLSNALPDIPLTTLKGQPQGYQFIVKIGDLDRAYDGLVCLFNQPQNGSVKNAPGTELDLSTMVTYYPSGKNTTYLDRDQYFELSPYHLSARSYGLDRKADPKNLTPFETELARQATDQYNQISMFGALMDPFSKVHAYSGILPITTLQLPPWTLQTAMRRMTAFFRMGPLVITTPDLQKRYKKTNDLQADYDLNAMEKAAATAPATKPDPNAPPAFTGIPLPALASASWNWLQPYAVSPLPPPPLKQGEKGATPNKFKDQHWNPFPIASLDNRPRFEPGPYTAIEGFLQLKKPIIDGKT